VATAQRGIPDGERLARVETRVEHLEQHMLALRQDIGQLRQDLQQISRDLHSKVDRNFLWTLGIIITMWVTVIISIVLRT